ncbi:HAMP domain-containing histidine kinase [Psychrobacillus sp.]|uniref:HAMP domain-containing sensor histidine kinase n=1 Tax=Psychrobacillus sp. TaxID=1871623 RepID=UPI0028BE045A|nr:HAMP domain-containing histidine kinase [Psychrobacillus sp.]
MKNWTLQKKWTYSSAISIFLSFLIMSIILYFSIYNWMLISEKKTAQNTLNELVLFFESKGPIITIQDIKRNTTLLNQIVNQEQSVRLMNTDGIEVLRINDASNFPPFSKEFSTDFKRSIIDNQLSFHKVAEIQFGTFIGYVEISHSLDNFSRLMKYILSAMFIFAVISLVLSALIGYTLSSVLLKPLKELRNEMQHAKQSKFSKEVSFQYSKEDEIGELLVIYKQLMNEVSETIKRQDDFIYNISHELRTPVQVVEGHLSLLNRWGKNEKEVLADSLEISLNEIQKMKKLIEEMLKLARSENAKNEVATNIVDVLTTIKKEFVSLNPIVSIDISAVETAVVAVPHTALEQIFRNLIENAIKYNDKTPYIQITATKKQQSIAITLEDNGIGIPPEHLPKVFDRFYTVETSRTKSRGGSGLGLSIVRMLVAEYEGIVEIDSIEGKGTIFQLEFPFVSIFQ